MLNDPKKQARKDARIANQLYNQLTPEEANQRLMAETFKRTTISFYRYFKIANPQDFRDEMYKNFNNLNVFGRVYVANEGINAQISLPADNLDKFKQYIDTIQELESLRLNIAVDDDGKSFSVLKIKVRQKIVADGIDDPDFDIVKSGKYVTADEFNKLSSDPSTVLLDMRNHYEYEVGHFENAKEIPSETFREQLNMAIDMFKGDEEKNVIMYCTGGIRCEKASAWMRHKGFKNVYHLEGGIINYANVVKRDDLDNKFKGKNFVFDGRLGERITDDILAHCHQCGKPCDTHVNCVNSGCHLLFIQCDECHKKYDRCCSKKCQNIIHLPEEKQRELRRGIKAGQKIFNKAKGAINRL